MDPWGQDVPHPGSPAPHRAPAADAKTRKAAGGAWAQPSWLALPTPRSDGRPRPRSPAAARAAEGRRPGLGLAPRAPASLRPRP